MPLFKVTLLFQQVTNPDRAEVSSQRIGGWSESWYFTGTSNALFEALSGGKGTGMVGSRANLLPITASIVGYRIQNLTDAGIPLSSRSYNFQYPGSSGLACDIPQAALLFAFSSGGSASVKRVPYRGVPDARIVQGEYLPSQEYQQAIETHFAKLQLFQFRAKNRNNVKSPIVGITAGGLVTTGVDHGLAVGNTVQIGRVHNNTIGLKSYKGLVQEPLTARTFTINGWIHGAGLGGYAQKYEIAFQSVQADLCRLERVITRKVGRPFDLYSGRANRR